MKILFPDGKATPKEIEELLAFAMEARRRVREHILRIDDTFKRHDFIYSRSAAAHPSRCSRPRNSSIPPLPGRAEARRRR